MRAAATGPIVILIACASLAAADEGDMKIMAPDAFRALVEGQTVHYTLNGEYYGSERFYGNDRATWQFPGGNCEDGRFWSSENEICFYYGSESCWTVMEAPDARRVAVSREGLSVLIDMIDDRPLKCDGNPIS